MSDTTSLRRVLRSRPLLFWIYAAASIIVLLTLMFLLADRATQPATTFEPTASTVEPVNDFVPAERSISECISAIPKPGCGSEARGGWRQSAVFVAILAGLAVIVWRVITTSRRARAGFSAQDPAPVSDLRTPDATSVPDDPDGGRAP